MSKLDEIANKHSYDNEYAMERFADALIEAVKEEIANDCGITTRAIIKKRIDLAYAQLKKEEGDPVTEEESIEARQWIKKDEIERLEARLKELKEE